MRLIDYLKEQQAIESVDLAHWHIGRFPHMSPEAVAICVKLVDVFHEKNMLPNFIAPGEADSIYVDYGDYVIEVWADCEVVMLEKAEGKQTCAHQWDSNQVQNVKETLSNSLNEKWQ